MRIDSTTSSRDREPEEKKTTVRVKKKAINKKIKNGDKFFLPEKITLSVFGCEKWWKGVSFYKEKWRDKESLKNEKDKRNFFQKKKDKSFTLDVCCEEFKL